MNEGKERLTRMKSMVAHFRAVVNELDDRTSGLKKDLGQNPAVKDMDTRFERLREMLTKFDAVIHCWQSELNRCSTSHHISTLDGMAQDPITGTIGV